MIYIEPEFRLFCETDTHFIYNVFVHDAHMSIVSLRKDVQLTGLLRKLGPVDISLEQYLASRFGFHLDLTVFIDPEIVVGPDGVAQGQVMVKWEVKDHADV